jgi:hypothetical protein
MATKDRIWVTRKCRILMESRLKRYALISEFLIPYYSLVIIALTIVPLMVTLNSDQKFFNLASLVGSLFILIISVLLSSQKYELRAHLIKEQYIELNKLYDIIDTENEHEISRQFNDILKQTENHLEADFIKLKIQLKNDKNSTIAKPTWLEQIKYYFIYIIKLFLVIVSFLAPLILFFIWAMIYVNCQ